MVVAVWASVVVSAAVVSGVVSVVVAASAVEASEVGLEVVVSEADLAVEVWAVWALVEVVAVWVAAGTSATTFTRITMVPRVGQMEALWLLMVLRLAPLKLPNQTSRSSSETSVPFLPLSLPSPSLSSSLLFPLCRTNILPFYLYQCWSRADVKQLPWSTSNEDLVELFETVGNVTIAEILYDGQRSKGEGVVQFTETAEAQEAGSKFTGYMYGGRPLGKLPLAR